MDRKELFITTKLWPTDFGFESTKEALKGSLERLGLSYIDMFLIHYPEVSSSCSDKWATLGETWRALECLYDEQLIKVIGVSNYSIEDLEKQSQFASIQPMVNQIEFHPYHQARELYDYCQDNRIQVQGYCPLGNGNLVKESVVEDIAKAVNRTPAQVLIRWSLQHNVPTIPKSTKKERVKENISVFDFCLNGKQMSELDKLDQNKKYVDVDTIKEKIDSNLPDGYRLDSSLKTNLFDS